MPYAINQLYESGQLIATVEIPWTEERVRAEARARRVATIEAGGTYLGHPIAADDRTMTQIVGCVVAAQMLPGYTVNWKMDDGVFLTLDAAGVVALARAVRLHIQDAFDAEKEVIDQIEAGQLTMEQIGEAMRGQ